MKKTSGYLPIEKITCYVGAKVRVVGIVTGIRNQGGLIFIDIKENDNLVQALVIPDNVCAYAMSKRISVGNVVEIKGNAKECPESVRGGYVKKTEIEVRKIAIISVRNKKENIRILGKIKNITKNKKKIII
ncbi:MAG TPA: OB-fold nucleic acid binding domain-containing protein [Candidatus Moranbacteria bacterium]|nr:OB-fold nucleic acid binding domain-containing protein [Candidatus Moranbacteria bacterium]